MADYLQDILKSQYNQLSVQPKAHLHLKSPKTGISLTDSWQKLDLNTTDFEIDMLGGFTLDDANDRIIWDNSNNYGISLNTLFIGDAGIEVTAGITGTISVTLGIFVDGNLILETTVNFTTSGKIQSYGANDLLIDDVTKQSLLSQGSYAEYYIKAGTGETPTVTIDYFNTTIQGR